MRVTLVTETFPPQVNGVSRTLGELVRRLGERGDAVQLVYPDYGDRPDRPDACRVRSISLPFYRELRLPLPPFGRVHRAIDAFGPDVIHVATEAFLGHSVLRHAERRTIPIVSSFHTNFDQYSAHYGVGWSRSLIWRYLRWFHNRTRATYVPSRTTIAQLERRGFERLALWPRGVDASFFRPDRPGRLAVREGLGWKPDDVVLTYVSRIAPEKNVDYLADALAIVAARRPGVRILFVGDGPSREDLEARMGDAARFVGYRVGDDLADHYAAGDVFAFTSTTETFGNVVLEAMASGLPVVALRAGGVGEIVRDGETGRLVAPDAPPDDFAVALLQLVDQAETRRRLAKAARAYAESQTWNAIMDDLRERYVGVIAQARGPGSSRTPRSGP
ncbi:glycosyltransferase family 4 protein [Planctomyces sp. SH-PL62]|uniref:glycosyltransferase family 4 protein n=1 Tax=Planctomyces sp. SH-PL62 TaxID=1636152 RepID=UPI00078C7094|nr:glycosyltransferase family 1 protein [Planctomyces sp. SH-PL62]AMV36928.1 GDP-mannose-dependent alpha-mannosyltransferase [Planctomyces sp. SH-PL62]